MPIAPNPPWNRWFVVLVCAGPRGCAITGTRRPVRQTQQHNTTCAASPRVGQQWLWRVFHRQQRPPTAGSHRPRPQSILALWHTYVGICTGTPPMHAHVCGGHVCIGGVHGSADMHDAQAHRRAVICACRACARALISFGLLACWRTCA